MYTDKHGEVCPAGWQPGADTIIPDPKVPSESTFFNLLNVTKNAQEKLAYFKKQGDLWTKIEPLGGNGCEVLFNNVCDQ